MSKSKSNLYVLTKAVWAGDIASAKKLIASGHSVDERDRLGKSSLMIATLNESTIVASLFLNLGADPNGVDNQGQSALHLAAEYHSVPLARLLLSAGANVDLQDAKGNTPLWNALYYFSGHDNEPQFVELMLKNGADPNRKNNQGVCPLDLQDESEDFAMVKKCLADWSSASPPPMKPSVRRSRKR